MPRSGIGVTEAFRNRDIRLPLTLTMLAGFVGAAAFTHSTGFFATAMSGNAQRGILGWFTGAPSMAAGALAITVMFLLGVITSSVLQHRRSARDAHIAMAVNTTGLIIASVIDLWLSPHNRFLGLVPVLFAAFGLGALNTAFSKNGEVSIPISYVTGSVVKLGQGIARHLHGSSRIEWAGYAIQYGFFLTGATIGGLASLAVSGSRMLYIATAGSVLVALYHYMSTSNGPRTNPVQATVPTPLGADRDHSHHDETST